MSDILSLIYMGLNVKNLLFLSHFNNCSNFQTDFRKLRQTNFIKTHSVAEELFHVDTQTDERKDDHNDVNNLFSKALVRF